MSDATARPEGRAVEAADIALGALVAVGAASRIDDLRIGRTNMLNIEFVLLSYGRQIVGEKYVGGLRDLVEQFLTLRGRHIDADAALAAVGMFHQSVAVRIERHATHVEKAAL